jgi:HTH-type transcriptional regulator / antitoxin HigA
MTIDTIIRPIRSDADHEAAMREVERLWGAKDGTPDGDRLDVLATLIATYEYQRWPFATHDAISAIEFWLEQQGGA